VSPEESGVPVQAAQSSTTDINIAEMSTVQYIFKGPNQQGTNVCFSKLFI